MRADGLAFILRDQEAVGPLLVENVEVIKPEVVQLFGQLPGALHGAQHLGIEKIVSHHLLRTVQQEDFAPDGAGRGFEKLQALPLRHRDQHVLDFVLRHGFQQFALLLGIP